MSRAVLAAVFLTAVWLDPAHVARAGGLVFWVLSLYLAWAGLLTVLAWRNWWWDFRLARAFHAIDIVVFIVSVFLTQAGNSYASSPFIAFTAFLLVTAMARGGRRGLLETAAALILSYGLAGFLFDAAGRSIDAYQFGRRLINMIALSLMMVWFGADVRVTRLAKMPEPGGIPSKRRDQILAGALRFIRQAFNARGAAIAVTRSEEPWIDLFRDIDGVFTHDRIGPGALTEDLPPDVEAALFDAARGRRIVALNDYRLEAVPGPFGHALADACGVSAGIVTRLTSGGSHGQLLVWGMSDACTDDLQVIGSLAREVALALDSEDMVTLAQSVAASDVRNAVARDLHDSVAQLLAGMLFRLEGMRRWVREGRDPETEILSLRKALRGEQTQLRSMIDRLRQGIDGDRATDIVGELETLLVEIGTHWQITTTLSCTRRPLPVSVGLAHELRQLVREAVANAVRHGQCSRVDLVLECPTEDLLQISIGDNGNGFPATSVTVRPRSISERIDALGGQLRIVSDTSGVRLDIDLPLPIAA